MENGNDPPRIPFPTQEPGELPTLPPAPKEPPQPSPVPLDEPEAANRSYLRAWLFEPPFTSRDEQARSPSRIWATIVLSARGECTAYAE